MSSVFAANTQSILTGMDAINGIYKIIRCGRCKKYSISIPNIKCPGCGNPLYGPSALIDLPEQNVLSYDMGFFDQIALPPPQETKITAYELIDQRVFDLLRNNRNWFAGVCGDTGTGKSYTCLRIGEMVDPKFDVDKVAFNVAELLELFDCVNKREIILFDEAEAWNARRAMKAENVVLGEVMSMLRFTQINVVCTLPTLEMVDINARRLMHDYLYARYIQRTKSPLWQRDKSAVDWYEIKRMKLPQNDKQGLYYRRPIIEYTDYEDRVVRKEKCGTVYFNAPSPSLLELYEEKKDRKFKEKKQSARKLLKAINKKGELKEEDPKPIPHTVAQAQASKTKKIQKLRQKLAEKSTSDEFDFGNILNQLEGEGNLG